MDKTDKYILMCEKAVEIQKLWEPEEGDFSKWATGVYIVEAEDLEEDDSKHWYWLPRQDQLQEMVEGECGMASIQLLLSKVSRFSKENQSWRSIDQLWLAFVMKEKFNKIWINNDWKTQ